MPTLPPPHTHPPSHFLHSAPPPRCRRALDFVEDYIGSRVLPQYGNTHTSASHVGHQTSWFRHEARSIVQSVTNASSERDVVIFAGSGCTAAVHKLIAALKLDRFAHHPKGCAVVFIGPHEHHSNILPWRECSGVEVVNIRESAVTGLLDCEHLKAQLEAYQDRPLLMGSFSAASNVTGALSEVNRITAMLKGAGALSFWDYASAGPCVRVDMNPVVSGDEDADGGSTTNPTLLRKDAICP